MVSVSSRGGVSGHREEQSGRWQGPRSSTHLFTPSTSRQHSRRCCREMPEVIMGWLCGSDVRGRPVNTPVCPGSSSLSRLTALWLPECLLAFLQHFWVLPHLCRLQSPSGNHSPMIWPPTGRLLQREHKSRVSLGLESTPVPRSCGRWSQKWGAQQHQAHRFCYGKDNYSTESWFLYGASDVDLAISFHWMKGWRHSRWVLFFPVLLTFDVFICWPLWSCPILFRLRPAYSAPADLFTRPVGSTGITVIHLWTQRLFPSLGEMRVRPCLPPPPPAPGSLPEVMRLVSSQGFLHLPCATLLFCSPQSHGSIFKHFIFRMLFSIHFLKDSLPRFRGHCCKSDYNGTSWLYRPAESTF